MKTVSKILVIVCFTLAVAACSSDDDPSTDDFFVGTYTGTVKYTNSDGDQESHDDGKVTVVKVASYTKYNFEFSDGIPNLNGVEFEKKGDNHLINIDFEEGVQYIKIDEDHLTMYYSKDDQVWEANADR